MVVWGCRFIFNITMFFMMIMTGQPTLTHPPRRPHWWKTNDDLLRVVFLYFGVVLSQWILSSGRTTTECVGIWIDESKGLSTFRDSHGSKRIHIWANRWWFQFFVFIPTESVTWPNLTSTCLQRGWNHQLVIHKFPIEIRFEFFTKTRRLFFTPGNQRFGQSHKRLYNSYHVCIISYCYICCHCFGYFRINKLIYIFSWTHR